jgi:hypothetical protein
VLIIFDTAGKAAGYVKTGDENDSVIGRAIVMAMETLAREFKTCVIGIDHFGKIAEVGTRGTSAKEGDTDFVLALLGDRDLAGAVTNPRMAIRKRRTGETGIEIPFKTDIVEIGKDEKDRPITTLVIMWTPNTAPASASSPGKPPTWAKTTRRLRQVLMNILVDHGEVIQPFPDGPTVRAANIETVRDEFFRQYPAEGNAAAKHEVRRKAFRRATQTAQERNLIGIREIGAITFIWLAEQTPTKCADRGCDISDA